MADNTCDELEESKNEMKQRRSDSVEHTHKRPTMTKQMGLIAKWKKSGLGTKRKF